MFMSATLMLRATRAGLRAGVRSLDASKPDVAQAKRWSPSRSASERQVIGASGSGSRSRRKRSNTGQASCHEAQ